MKCAVEHRLNPIQRRPSSIPTLRGIAADLQVIDAHAVSNSRAIVFIGKTFPCFVDCDDVSFPVEHGDVGRQGAEDSLVEGLGPAQRLFRLLAFRDVVEEDCDLPLLGPADSERVDVVEPAEGKGRILKPPRLAGPSNLPVNLEPVLLVRRRDLAHPASNGVRDAGLLLKDPIDFQKAVVKRVVRVIEQYLDHAETLVDRIKQGAVLLLRLAQLPVGVLE